MRLCYVIIFNATVARVACENFYVPLYYFSSLSYVDLFSDLFSLPPFQQEARKDEKNIIRAKPFIPAQNGSMKIYNNKAESSIQIYEDNFETETCAQLREFKEKREIEAVQETVLRSGREYGRLEVEVNTSVSTSRVAFLNNQKQYDQKKDEEEDEVSKDSPMSLGMSIEKPVSCNNSLKDEYENESFRDGKNIFDVEEYRADIYNYLREAEVCIRLPGY